MVKCPCCPAWFEYPSDRDEHLMFLARIDYIRDRLNKLTREMTKDVRADDH